MTDDKITMDAVEEKLRKKVAKYYALCEQGNIANGDQINACVVVASSMKELSLDISKLKDVEIIAIVKGHQVKFSKKIVLEVDKG